MAKEETPSPLIALGVVVREYFCTGYVPLERLGLDGRNLTLGWTEECIKRAHSVPLTGSAPQRKAPESLGGRSQCALP